jgi:cytidine deaminase
MQNLEHIVSFELYDSIALLSTADAALLQEAKKATGLAHAPYSRFKVGAAARLISGEIVLGANQENASFPAGLCAERVLLSVASSQYPGIAIDSMAISYVNEQGPADHPISPCGICRQSLLEFEQRMKKPVRLILAGAEGKVYVIPQAGSLLPLAFSAQDLA